LLNYTIAINVAFDVCRLLWLMTLQKVAAGLALMQTDSYTDVLTWEVNETDCPRQDKYIAVWH